MKCLLIQQTFNTGIQQVTDNHSTHTAHFHTESYLSTAQTTRHTATYIKQSIIKNTYFGEVRWDENARTNDAAARFKLTREILCVSSVKYYSELNTVPKLRTLYRVIRAACVSH